MRKIFFILISVVLVWVLMFKVIPYIAYDEQERKLEKTLDGLLSVVITERARCEYRTEGLHPHTIWNKGYWSPDKSVTYSAYKILSDSCGVVRIFDYSLLKVEVELIGEEFNISPNLLNLFGSYWKTRKIIRRADTQMNREERRTKEEEKKEKLRRLGK